MDKLMKYVCKEMEDLEKQVEDRGGFTSNDLHLLETLSRIKKNLLKAEEMSEESEGSYRGSYRGSYADGSYENGSRGSYAEPMYADMERTDESRYSTRRRRDSMGRYSREDGYSRADGMIEELRNMMGDLPANKQRELQQLIKRYEA
jgi:hypothetical protein